MSEKIQVTFWGGVGTVTGANFLLEVGETKSLVDCGLLQGTMNSKQENESDFQYDPKTIHYLFVTHAHMDHIGKIPKLVKDGFSGIIYSTPETKELAHIMLQDALKIMDMNSRMNVDMPDKPLYGVEDYHRAFELWKTIPYHTDTKINEKINVYLKDAGHILGSSIYEFTAEGKKIVFTGDSGNSPAPLLNDTEKITDADYMIVDSVYGDRNHEDKDERDARFRQIVTESIEAGGAIVIPAFSIERTQVILYELNNLIEENKIPKIPVFLDSPLGSKVTDIYSRHAKNFNQDVRDEIKRGDNIFDFPKLTITRGRRDSQEIANTPNPKIIIAGSGMSSGGRVLWHEMEFLPDPKSTILLMGYQALGTLGRDIQNKPREVEINGNIIPVKARIEMISGYSSHKDSDGIVGMVENSAQSLKKVFVVLGEPKSAVFLAQRLRDELEVTAIHPERGVPYKLDI